VRDIAKKAETHLSALNYHFRSKDALYRDVVREACRADSISEKDRRLLLGLEPRKALLTLIKEALKQYAGQTSSNWQLTVITRECWEPTRVFEEVVQEYFKPEADVIAQIIGKITDQPPDSHKVRFAVVVLISTLETFGFYGHLIDAIAPGMSDHFSKGDLLAKRITHLVIEAADPNLGE
jgi:AcrR family transcriptional regulator